MNALNNNAIDPAGVIGWGADADPDNDPTRPMRDRSQDDKGGMNWKRPALQEAFVEVLHSTERPNLTAVFGTSSPPRGLSGLIRRRAFRKSEGKWGHWLMLLFADRINVVEGIFQDFAHGRFPHIFREMGVRAEIKHNYPGFLRKLAIAIFILAVVVLLLFLALKSD
jgi:hypothetical protein